MKRQHITIIVLSAIIVIAVSAVAWGTIAILSSIDSNKQENTPAASEDPKKEEEPENTFGDPVIDEDKDKLAEAIEAEAVNLIETNPEQARVKYLEAAEAYKEAGNVSKSSEMTADATTAELLAQQQQSQ